MLGLAAAGYPVHYRNPAQTHGISPEQVAANLWVYRDFDQLPKGVGQQAIYFVYYPAYAAWLDANPQQFIVYDCIDDDPVFEAYESLMLKKANLVITVSKQLLQKLQGQHPQVVLVTNGVDLKHYQRDSQLPEELAAFKGAGRPLIGFSGAFYRGWVDMSLVYKIASMHPEWQVVIVGEAYDWDFSNAPENLLYLGSRSYQSLPDYLRAFDVGLIPFVDNQIARGADPVKLYEYMAAGIPVISRKLPFVDGWQPPLVYSYDTETECLAAISRALQDTIGGEEENYQMRLKAAAQNSWDFKVKQIIGELAKYTWLEQ